VTAGSGPASGVTAGRVDAHHHLWDPDRRPLPWMDGPWADPIRRAFTEDDLAAAATPHGIRQTVVVQAVADLDETRELLGLAARSPLVAGVVGWADLTDPAIADVLDDLLASPGGDRLVGVRAMVQDEPDPDWLRRSDVHRGLRAVAAAGLVYDLLVRPAQLPAAVAVLPGHPELTVVLDHGGKPEVAAGRMRPWSALVGRLAELPTVFCKVSGLVTEADHRLWRLEDIAPYVDRLVATFGSQRLLFGSDWPVCLLAASYGEVVDLAERTLAGVPAEEVFGGTARRVYGLPDP
jgi:L-fuconolactonase